MRWAWLQNVIPVTVSEGVIPIRCPYLRGGHLVTQKCYHLLYGCETWSVTFRGHIKLYIFENRMSRKVFGLKKDGVSSLGYCITRNFVIC